MCCPAAFNRHFVPFNSIIQSSTLIFSFESLFKGTWKHTEGPGSRNRIYKVSLSKAHRIPEFSLILQKCS